MTKCDFRLRHGRSPISLLHIFRTPFLKNISGSGWLLSDNCNTSWEKMQMFKIFNGEYYPNYSNSLGCFLFPFISHNHYLTLESLLVLKWNSLLLNTAWKIFVFRVFQVCIQPEYRKIRTRKTPNTRIQDIFTDHFFALLSDAFVSCIWCNLETFTSRSLWKMKLMQGNIYVFASVIKNQCSICKIHTTKFIKLLIVTSKEKLSKKINYPQIKK